MQISQFKINKIQGRNVYVCAHACAGANKSIEKLVHTLNYLLLSISIVFCARLFVCAHGTHARAYAHSLQYSLLYATLVSCVSVYIQSLFFIAALSKLVHTVQ